MDFAHLYVLQNLLNPDTLQSCKLFQFSDILLLFMFPIPPSTKKKKYNPPPPQKIKIDDDSYTVLQF